MSFSRSREAVPALIELDSTPSTNAALVTLAAMPSTVEYTTVVTRDQTAGRGRLDRDWVAPPGASLAISVLLRPRAEGRSLPIERFGWLPIAAGVAMTLAVAEHVRAGVVGFKWPNDVQIGGRKVSGVLAELLPPRGDADPRDGAEPGGVVIGAGVNLAMREHELPVPTATSLALHGVTVDSRLEDEVLASYLRSLRTYVDDYVGAGGDADASGLRARALELCTTIGRSVRVELPGGALLSGTATNLDHDGRLVVVDADDRERSVAAGDVTHVR
jgi:BirA family biotin operon repressor/biotin-[acetyl-CoA-carboxylase] ligase